MTKDVNHNWKGRFINTTFVVLRDGATFYISLLTVCFVIAATYCLYLEKDYANAIKFTKYLTDKVGTFLIFVPSLSFVILGMFPSFSDGMKLKFLDKDEDGELLLYEVLDLFIYIMYWSIISIIMSYTLRPLYEINSTFLSENLKCALTSVAFSSLCFILISLIYELFNSIYTMYRLIMEEQSHFVQSLIEKKNGE